MDGVRLTADERRALADELAGDLVQRGLALADVERLAPLLVDRFRRAAQGAGARRADALQAKEARCAPGQVTVRWAAWVDLRVCLA